MPVVSSTYSPPPFLSDGHVGFVSFHHTGYWSERRTASFLAPLQNTAA